MTELWTMSACELAAGIARKNFSCSEVVEAHLRRIEAVNPSVNAIVKTLSEEARRGAAEADGKVAAGEALGPLHGVPFTIKENIDVAGLPTTWGVPALAGAHPPVDAPIHANARRGAIPIGRTNPPEMGLRMHTDSSLHGLTRNPWSAKRTASGSRGRDGQRIGGVRSRQEFAFGCQPVTACWTMMLPVARG
jgi:amidase